MEEGFEEGDIYFFIFIRLMKKMPKAPTKLRTSNIVPSSVVGKRNIIIMSKYVGVSGGSKISE